MKTKHRYLHLAIDATIIGIIVAAIAVAVASMPEGPTPEQMRYTADSIAIARTDSIVAARAERARIRRERHDSIDSARHADRGPVFRPSPLGRPIPDSRPR